MATRDRTDTQQGMQRRPTGSASRSSNEPFSSSGAWLDPLTQFRRLSEQMDRWFQNMGMSRTQNRMGSFDEGAWAQMWAPELETFSRNDQFVVRMDLPGLNRDDVNVEVTDDAIVIHGERRQSHEEERDGYFRTERSYGRFYREVPLPEGAKGETARANFRDGVLEVSVTAPPRQVNRPRRIEIGSSAAGEKQEERQRSAQSNERMLSIAHDTGRDEPSD